VEAIVVVVYASALKSKDDDVSLSFGCVPGVSVCFRFVRFGETVAERGNDERARSSSLVADADADERASGGAQSARAARPRQMEEPHLTRVSSKQLFAPHQTHPTHPPTHQNRQKASKPRVPQTIGRSNS
jgi:hypothetical protein